MNKKLFSLIIFILGFNLVNAQQVDFKTVEKVAQNYFTAIKPNVKNNTPELVYTGKANYEDKTGKSFKDIPMFYVFNFGDNECYVLVSADYIVKPILVY